MWTLYKDVSNPDDYEGDPAALGFIEYEGEWWQEIFQSTTPAQWEEIIDPSIRYVVKDPHGTITGPYPKEGPPKE